MAYDKEKKDEILKDFYSSDLSLKKFASKSNVSYSTLHKWVKNASIEKKSGKQSLNDYLGVGKNQSIETLRELGKMVDSLKKIIVSQALEIQMLNDKLADEKLKGKGSL